MKASEVSEGTPFKFQDVRWYAVFVDEVGNSIQITAVQSADPTVYRVFSLHPESTVAGIRGRPPK